MKNREILQQPRTVFVQAVKVSNLETRRVDRNETVGVGNCSADRVIRSASGEAVEHSVELSIDAASLHHNFRNSPNTQKRKNIKLWVWFVPSLLCCKVGVFEQLSTHIFEIFLMNALLLWNRSKME